MIAPKPSAAYGKYAANELDEGISPETEAGNQSNP